MADPFVTVIIIDAEPLGLAGTVVPVGSSYLAITGRREVLSSLDGITWTLMDRPALDASEA